MQGEPLVLIISSFCQGDLAVLFCCNFNGNGSVWLLRTHPGLRNYPNIFISQYLCEITGEVNSPPLFLKKSNLGGGFPYRFPHNWKVGPKHTIMGLIIDNTSSSFSAHIIHTFPNISHHAGCIEFALNFRQNFHESSYPLWDVQRVVYNTSNFPKRFKKISYFEKTNTRFMVCWSTCTAWPSRAVTSKASATALLHFFKLRKSYYNGSARFGKPSTILLPYKASPPKPK